MVKKEKLIFEDKTFEMLRDLIYEKSGIYFMKNKKYLLENRLINRVRECNFETFTEYYYYLKYNGEEIKRLFNSITTNETSFFRYPPQMTVFENSILPSLITENKKRKRHCLKIWSAGCSTGQEPYTLAMILAEYHLDKKGWKIEILANDISENVITSARNGIYKKNMVAGIPQRYLNRYFENSGENYRITNEIKAMIRFENINLMDQNLLDPYKDFDIVFCRNVLIYFDDEAKRKLINRIYDALIPKGYLFIGHSESLHSVTKTLRPLHFDKAIVYKKE